ncbi:MAG: hypothetical protein A3B89_04905 [Candidatus Buchananbacteria bacterium RIFCSPHIGHO2_02_FULL_40_13]|uniref:Uncharacterized protein n=1 Tax=Candidatus Buchananbacteria bacterium RIFCSPLOWO2_01_FULL_39_33 TaxID=1797543 RepID=A0A1G1YMQ7_9BACT|nr:MAG: hypothetical protein A2820_00230 [Candidatus Buchananbacteria bacterium RIFCSPHIGHO2_01_FULL_40_35]OGY49781.1 MAG: hypothetical protein A3B89_04905 [Candidatus Buchananbacteria bacterium RIFCSPHIGHO2_02_FULL_40_13]OGY52727.1 MAG: hypothetical protein A3A02_02720 [Candidatus Buchananbacteria bacterium RIFCSPLOWO2_01_FULL_39_33]
MGEERYILSRRVADGFNEVIKAKSAPLPESVDFNAFIASHSLDPLEVAQFLKVSHADVHNLIKFGGWIEPAARSNLLKLLSETCNRSRKEFCRFLMAQAGNVGTKNIPLGY